MRVITTVVNCSAYGTPAVVNFGGTTKYLANINTSRHECILAYIIQLQQLFRW